MTPQDCIIIPLTRGYSTVIDNKHSDLALYHWHAAIRKHSIYASRKVNGKIIFLHQIILSRMLNRNLLPKEFPDHIDGNGLNNLESNIRLASKIQNCQNQRLQTNKTGYKGVSVNGKGYLAYITVNKKRLYLGTHATPELAAAAYDKAAVKHFGEFALTNKMIKVNHG